MNLLSELANAVNYKIITLSRSLSLQAMAERY